VLVLDEPGAELVALKQPAGGTWSVAEDPGSTPITDVAVAHALPAPRIRASVTGRGGRRTLRYRLNAAPGRQVTFAERGPHMYRVIGLARGSGGRIKFTPGTGAGGPRDIVAEIVEGGMPAPPLVVAHYVAPAPARPSRPRAVRVARSGSTLTVSWSKASGAAEYEVAVLLGNGRQTITLTRAHRIRVAGIPADRGGSVLVYPISAALRSTNPARASFHAVKAAPRRPKRRHH
jgi:hypothetical protein